MKKKGVLAIVLILLFCSACSKSPSAESGQQSKTDKRPEVFSQDEYVLYQNVFYSDYGKKYAGSKITKEGIFATVYDAFNKRQRYYVWGYYDQTKCCDWQWEFVPQAGEALPPVGSLITVTGTIVSAKEALDGYWIIETHTEAKQIYSGPSADLDMLGMSCTLERVQMLNILSHPEDFQDREFLAYGRIASQTTLENPYYDGSWKIPFSWEGNVPATGTLVEISGTVKDGKLILRSMKKQ